MNTVLIDALSVTNQSGRQFLRGHLRTLAEGLAGRRLVVLHHAANADLVAPLSEHVAWRECPASTQRWGARVVWENLALGRIARQEGASVYFSPAGVGVPTLRIPQIVFCQNPWALVRALHRTVPARVKAACQRMAYRRAVQQSQVMVFNSAFMREAYRANAGRDPRRSHVVYQGIGEETFAAAHRLRGTASRVAGRILCVSAMAPHKGVEFLLRAVAMLRGEGVPAELELIGAWPDTAYRQRIERVIGELSLLDGVKIRGHVPLAALHQAYAEAQVFCLMSECESFGFPAVEAHAFGTPTVCANSTAMPEIQADGGSYVAPGDVGAAAAALGHLLTDNALWQRRSAAARENAERFHWNRCSPPLLEAFEDL